MLRHAEFTIGYLSARRIILGDALGNWGAQLVGGMPGTAALYSVFRTASSHPASMGSVADGNGVLSMIGANAACAFVTEVVLTLLFILVSFGRKEAR